MHFALHNGLCNKVLEEIHKILKNKGKTMAFDHT